MLRWEAHNALSASLGDVTVNTPVTLLSGVRFSIAQRDSYLYRAMCDLHKKLISQIIPLPRSVSSLFIDKIFPNSIDVNIINNSILPVIIGKIDYYQMINLGLTIPVVRNWDYISGIKIIAITTNFIYPLPLKSPIEVSGLLNTHSIQRPDTFGLIVRNNWIDIYDGTTDLRNGFFIEVIGILEPLNPANQLITDRLTIDTIYTNTILSLATLYGMAESQDIESIDRFMPALIDIPQINQQGHT